MLEKIIFGPKHQTLTSLSELYLLNSWDGEKKKKSLSSYQFAHNRVDCHPSYTPIVWCFVLFCFLKSY